MGEQPVAVRVSSLPANSSPPFLPVAVATSGPPTALVHAAAAWCIAPLPFSGGARIRPHGDRPWRSSACPRPRARCSVLPSYWSPCAEMYMPSRQLFARTGQSRCRHRYLRVPTPFIAPPRGPLVLSAVRHLQRVRRITPSPTRRRTERRRSSTCTCPCRSAALHACGPCKGQRSRLPCSDRVLSSTSAGRSAPTPCSWHTAVKPFCSEIHSGPATVADHSGVRETPPLWPPVGYPRRSSRREGPPSAKNRLRIMSAPPPAAAQPPALISFIDSPFATRQEYDHFCALSPSKRRLPQRCPCCRAAQGGDGLLLVSCCCCSVHRVRASS